MLLWLPLLCWAKPHEKNLPFAKRNRSFAFAYQEIILCDISVSCWEHGLKITEDYGITWEDNNKEKKNKRLFFKQVQFFIKVL